MTSPWMLVATREIVVRALNKGFLIGLAITMAMIGGLIGSPPTWTAAPTRSTSPSSPPTTPP